MKRLTLFIAALCLLGFSYAETVTRTFYFDFGMDGGTRGTITTSPDDNGHYWNNIGDKEVTSNRPSIDHVYSIVDAANAATDIKVQLADTKFTANGMSDGGGLLTPDAELLGDLAVATATEDYLFASNSEHCTIGISGLDPEKGYQFKVFASRVATDDRVSNYTFRGAWAIQGSLKAAGTGIGANGENQNTSNVYLSPVMRPNAEGKISITVHRQFAGSGAYFPISCMRMQEMTDLHVADREIYIDCGHSDGTNGELTAAPDDNGIYWVNLYDNAATAAPVALTYKDGSAVNNGANVTIAAAFQRNGYNNGGNTAATYSSLLGVFGQKSVAGDYFFVNKKVAQMKFNGLDPDKAYVFYIFGSRAYNQSFGQTVDKLKLEGLTTVNGTHHTGGNGMCYSGSDKGWNEDAFTVMEPVFPDADGAILLTLSDERGSYQHINGMRIEEYSDYAKPTPAEETKYAALLMKGTAVEDGEVPMYLRAAEGKTEGTSFEAFCRITNGGTLSFETPEAEVLSSVTCALADGIYRIVYNTTEKTFTSLAITRVGLVGNVTTVGWDAAGMEMTYQGKGVWAGTFDLVAHTGTDAERGQFCMNSSWDLTVKSRNGVEGIVGFTPDAEDCGFSVEDIYMRHGRKEVTLDMRNFTYSIECVEVADNKITFFGSSVCNGQGASEYGNIKHGYAWQYGQLLAARHESIEGAGDYEYSNTSINGNNTLNLLSRYKGHMYGDCGTYVVIGLGLGNEGIHESANKQATYDQWKTNMGKLIALGEEEGKVVVATNNYPRGDYNATDYSYVKRMNLEMHEWDIPTVNFLGALDNCKGDGQWADGYQVSGDIYHPTEAGHTEFMHAIVPSLFDALAAGKAKPARQSTEGTSLNAKTQLILTPEDEVHSFTVAFKVSNISGLKLTWDLTSGTAPEATTATLDVDWHTVVISHYYAAGKTYVYKDGVQQSVTDGKLLLKRLTLSGLCKVADLHFWRAGMNADEIAAWEQGKMLCSSLELYCPLDNGVLSNLAQSTNQLILFTDEATALEQTNDKMVNDKMSNVYTILGQPADASFRGTVLIIDGKKVLR
ncbi:MAG: SGNH/GDSL hydrolase family protein [Paludibacteraceae bacterium]|nr:SGNH/GDSL hydrolase family protein [Paludibacteraceae bacterium]